MSTTAPTASSPRHDTTPRRDNHTPSCAVCQRRKVKCNRVFPCGPCQKTGLQCEYKPAPQHGRKRLKRSGDDGEPDSCMKPRDAVESGRSAAKQPDLGPTPVGGSPGTARLVSDVGGGYRYVNNHLWSAISTQAHPGATPTATANSTPRPEDVCRSPEGISGNSIYESSVSLGSEIAGRGQNGGISQSGRHFVFNQPQTERSLSIQATQPPANYIVQLWQTYLTNIDPILKIVHAPTLQQTVLGQIGKPALSTSLQALTSAIYFISVVALQEDECEALLQASRTELIHGYRQATEDALSAAGFMTTADLTVLQAFVMYLAALRSLGETPTVWCMTGLAIRIAGTIGLARAGSILNLPPFECEMRRRLWWALVYLDARTAELVGKDGDLLVQRYGVHLPANLNDSQLFPNMQRLPESRPAATEMSYILLRATLATCLNSMRGAPGPAGTWQRLRATSVPMAEKASIVESLEHRFHEQIIRFCDPTVPLQAFTMNASQTFLTKMRLVGNIPFDRSAATAGSIDGYSENLFQLAMKMMRLQLELFHSPSMQRWKWHWQGQFQWYALAELLRQTRLRQPGPETMKAWSLIREVFDTVVPTLELAPQKSPLLEAVRALLHAATTCNQEQTRSATQAAGEHGPAGPGFSSVNGRPSPSNRQMVGFSTGQGSRPYSALLPGLDSMPTPPSMGDQPTASVGGLDDTAFGLDFDAIDWVEFDRLISELCGQ